MRGDVLFLPPPNPLKKISTGGGGSRGDHSPHFELSGSATEKTYIFHFTFRIFLMTLFGGLGKPNWPQGPRCSTPNPCCYTRVTCSTYLTTREIDTWICLQESLLSAWDTVIRKHTLTLQILENRGRPRFQRKL